MPVLPRLLFVHIPKTAGISLYSALERIYGAERSLRFTGHPDLPDLKDFTPEALRQYDLISGHAPLPDFLARGLSDRTPISVLREPRDRLLSAYHYVRGWPEHPMHAQLTALSLDSYIDLVLSDLRFRGTWWLAGTSSFSETLPMLDRYKLIAPYDDLQRATQVLSGILGAPLDVGRLNETAYPPDAERFSAAQEDLLRARFADEFDLYDEVVARWSEAAGDGVET